MPRLNNRRGRLYGRVAGIPRAVGGPRAHPPKAEANRKERINKKEKKAALNSAIASSIRFDLVSARHIIEKDISLPIIIEDKFEEIAKTQDLNKVLENLKIKADLDNAKDKVRRRAGKGKMRGRLKKQKKSILIVTAKNAEVFKAARNLPGVEICVARNLNTELFAPGAVPGRLTLWSESALKAFEEKKGKVKK